jgi:hypothetical protein
MNTQKDMVAADKLLTSTTWAGMQPLGVDWVQLHTKLINITTTVKQRSKILWLAEANLRPVLPQIRLLMLNLSALQTRQILVLTATAQKIITTVEMLLL